MPAPEVNEDELLSSLAFYGVNSIGSRNAGFGEKAKFARMCSQAFMEKSFVDSRKKQLLFR